MKSPFSKHIYRVLLVLVLAFGVLWLGRHFHWSLPALVQELRNLGPLLFFSGLTALITLGAPASPFFLMAGASFPFRSTVIGIALSLFLSISLARLLFRYLFQDLMNAFLKKSKIPLEHLPVGDHAKLVSIVRVTPGIPFVVQNCILVAAKVSYPLEVAISWPILFGWGIAYAFLGERFASGSFGKVIPAIGLLILLFLFFGLFRKRLSRSQQSLGKPVTGPLA